MQTPKEETSGKIFESKDIPTQATEVNVNIFGAIASTAEEEMDKINAGEKFSFEHVAFKDYSNTNRPKLNRKHSATMAEMESHEESKDGGTRKKRKTANSNQGARKGKKK